MSQTTPTKQMLFITIPELKAKLKVETISVVKNPATDKLFANTGTQNFKVEQAIDFELPIKFMYESEEKFNEGCIVNVTSENTIRTL